MADVEAQGWGRRIRLGAAAFAVLWLAGCGGGASPRDPGRAKYEADKSYCDSISGGTDAARKSCMTYRGWPDGKYRR